MLFSRLDILYTDYSPIDGIPDHMMLHVDVSCSSTAKPVLGHLDSALVVLVNTNVVVDWRYHKRFHLPKET